MTSNRESFDELADALDVFLTWKSAGRPGDTKTLLAAHADQRELLEHLLAEDEEEAAATATPEGRVLDDFRIVREIGRGGMGVVFEAEQLSLSRRVALKVLPPHITLHPISATRLQNEARLIGGLRHPGIVQVFAFGSDRDEHYLAMELVEGRPLDDVLREFDGGMPPHRAASIAAQVADALHHAHAHHIVHRDVKPSNILLREDGETAVLTDFGIARDEGLPSLTMTGDFMGTPYYVSPEQVSARRVVLDHRTDVYSLGASLYEMVTGHKVFEGDTSAEILTQILSREPRPAHKLDESVPADLSAIIATALEKDPDKRYLTAEAFAVDLRRYLEGVPVHARHITRIERTWRFAKRQPALAASLAALFVTLVVGLFVTLTLYSKSQASLADYTRLADGVLLDGYATKSRETLWPAVPTNAGAMRDWIGDVESLTARLEQYRRKLEELRENAEDYSDADRNRDRSTHPRTRELATLRREHELYRVVGADAAVPPARQAIAQRLLADTDAKIAELTAAIETRRTYRFAAHQDQFLHDTLATVVSALERFATPETGLLAEMRRRLAFAESIEHESITRHAATWQTTIAAIHAHPDYKGLELSPQLGLVPIGRDPKSGFFEFAHLQTGAVPTRDARGELSIGPDTGIVFVLLPGGSCVVGSQATDLKRPNFDRDRHHTRDGALRETNVDAFFLAKYEMTQGQWLRFAGTNPSGYAPHEFLTVSGRTMSLRHPVEQVSFADCRTTLRQLGLRLPNNDEWEYACRAGTDTVWSTGGEITSLRDRANIKDRGSQDDFAPGDRTTAGIDDGYSSHAPVGTYLPNEFGLYDMHGNVAEWVDRHGEATATESRAEAGSQIVRGGSHLSLADDCRAAAQVRIDQNSRVVDTGCRPVHTVER